ncbi:HPP family protein, partial [Flavihumibacter sediminis]|nr:HPP family protein [Flavihumibacter sediminis]
MLKKRVKRTLRYTRYIYYRETLVNREEKFWSFLGSFIGIGLIAFWQSFLLKDSDSLFLIGSFGASSVLVFGLIQSPLAQPRNLIG